MLSRRHAERHPARRPPDYLARGPQLRLLTLVFGLAAVLFLMSRLREADIVAALGRVFGLAQARDVVQVEDITEDEIAALLEDGNADRLPADAVRVIASPPTPLPAAPGLDDPRPISIDPAWLAAIEDNTRFRAAEVAAWFQILQILAATSPAKIAAASTGEISYVQLLRQPELYRGKVVSVKGTVRQAIAVAPAANDLELKTYYRLVIRPAGGTWPVVVYTLELPDGFPLGEQVDEEVRLSGFFFKNWSYPQQEGLGLAPVLLTRTIDWQPRDSTPLEADNRPARSMVWILLLATTLAAATTTWLWWRTTRLGVGDRSASLPDRLEWGDAVASEETS